MIDWSTDCQHCH